MAKKIDQSSSYTPYDLSYISHVFHRWRNRFVSAKPSIVHAEARFMSDQIPICSSRGRMLWKVMNNEDDAEKTGLLLDQKHGCINYHYFKVFWWVKSKNVICTQTILK